MQVVPPMLKTRVNIRNCLLVTRGAPGIAALRSHVRIPVSTPLNARLLMYFEWVLRSCLEDLLVFAWVLRGTTLKAGQIGCNAGHPCLKPL